MCKVVAVTAFERAKPLSLPLTFALHGVRSLFFHSLFVSSIVLHYLHYLKGFVCSLQPSSHPKGTEAVLLPDCRNKQAAQSAPELLIAKVSPTRVGKGTVLTWDTLMISFLSYALCKKKKVKYILNVI